MLTTQGTVAANGVACVKALIADGWCRSASYVGETASTNTLALDQLNDPTCDFSLLPRLFLTDSQSAGRGRRGRTWSSSDDSLTFSLLLRTASIPGATQLPLSLLVGVLTADAIDALISPEICQIKWPNDLYLRGQKVGGILVEINQKHPQLAVVGIGINVRCAPDANQLDPQAKASALREFTDRPLDRFDVLDEVVRQLRAPQPAGDVAAAMLHRFRHKCWLTGQRIQLMQAGKRVEGICRGIDAAGQLVLDVDGRTIAVHSGEAALVRRDPLGDRLG